MKESTLLITALLLLTSCVKEEGKVLTSNAGTGGTSTGGSVSGPVIPDPLFAESWHLKNTGQKTFSTTQGLAGEDISADPVHEMGYTGEGIRIAVSDTGTDFNHEDLTGNQLVGEHRNYFVADSNLWHGSLPYHVGSDAHGTATTGLIAAVGWNGLGSRGVAPKAKFAAFRYIGNMSGPPASFLVKSIDQADGNFDIFNYSYGYPQCYFNEEDPLALQAFKDGVSVLRGGKGALYVQSAGNDFLGSVLDCLGATVSPDTFAGNTNTSDDMAIPEKIIVAATNASGLKSSYSTPGSGIWVSAPGGEYGTSEPAMLTTDISGCGSGYSLLDGLLNIFNRGSDTKNKGCNYTSLMNGTSSAAPVVSGVIALMLQANPALSWRDVKHILALTSTKLDFSLTEALDHPIDPSSELLGHVYDMKWTLNAAGIKFSNWYGFGRVNALEAVLMATTYAFPLGIYESTSNPATEEWYYDSGSISLAIPDANPIGTDIGNLASYLQINHNFIVESVQVELNIDHPSPKDLAISIMSPSGLESRLLNINSNLYASSFPANKLLITNAFYGEESLGNWRIHVVDGSAASGTGTLDGWRIKINGRRVQGDGNLPNPVTNVTMPGTYPSAAENSITPPFSFTQSTSSDVKRYEISVGTTSGAVDILPWTSIGMLDTSVQQDQISLLPETTYYLNIRAVDDRENVSLIVTRTWQSSI